MIYKIFHPRSALFPYKANKPPEKEARVKFFSFSRPLDLLKKCVPFVIWLLYLSLSLIASVASALLTYFTIYYFYVPPPIADRPLHFVYDSNCFHGLARYNQLLMQTSHESLSFLCTEPFTHVHFTNQDLFFFRQSYEMSIVLSIPDTELNRRSGIFMVSLTLLSNKNERIVESLRPAMLPYRSKMLVFLDTLIFLPLYLLGYSSQQASTVLVMMENFMEDPFHKLSLCHIQLHSKTIQITDARLLIHPNYNWLQWFVYHCPWLTGVVVSSVLLCLYVPLFMLILYPALKQTGVQCWSKLTVKDVKLEVKEDDEQFFDAFYDCIKEEPF